MLRRDCAGTPFSPPFVSVDGLVLVFELAVFWFVELDAVDGPAVTSSYAGGGPSIGAAILTLETYLVGDSGYLQSCKAMVGRSLYQELDAVKKLWADVELDGDNHIFRVLWLWCTAIA
jgi:hypothetical protein